MIKKIVSTFTVKVFIAILNLLGVILISRYLGAEGRGEVSLITVTISILLNFTYIFGGGTLVYLTPRYNLIRLLLPSYLWCLIVSVIGYFVLLTFNSIQQSFAIHIALLTFLNSLFSVNTSMLLGKEKISENNLFRLLQSLLTIVALILIMLVWGNKTTFSFIISLYVAFSVCFLASFLRISKYFAFEENWQWTRTIKDMFKLGLFNQLGDILQLLCLRLNFYVLNKYSGESTLGIYSNAAAVIESILLITTSITVVQYSRIANSEDKTASAELTLRLGRLSTFICLILIIPILFLPSKFYVLIFGTGFEEMPIAIQALAPGILFYNFGLIIIHYFEGIGKYEIKAICSMIGLIALAIISMLLMPNYNLVKAGISSSFSYLILTISLLIFFKRERTFNLLELIPLRADFLFFKKKLAVILGKNNQ